MESGFADPDESQSLKGATVTPRKIDYPKTRKVKRLIDRTGDVYGRLTVIEFRGYNKKRQSTWLCRCECGKEKVFPLSNIRNGNSKSCGCLQEESRRRKVGPRPWMSKGPGIASRNNVLYAYRARAKRRGWAWSLTLDEAITLLQGNCHYCGCEPYQYLKNRDYTGNFIYNGIDRIDSSKGYEPDNVVSCCKVCNLNKGKMSYTDFCGWIAKAYANLSKEGRIPVLKPGDVIGPRMNTVRKNPKSAFRPFNPVPTV